MSKSEEFRTVKTGLPTSINPRKTRWQVLFPFFLVGAILACTGLVAGIVFNYLIDTYNIYTQSPLLFIVTNIASNSIYMGVLAFLVGVIQVVILKKRIRSRSFLYLIFSAAGGAAGGITGGLLISTVFTKNFFDIPLLQLVLGNSSPSDLIIFVIKALLLVTKSVIMGTVTGLIVGSIIAITQNLFMRNNRYGFKWASYCIVIWVISCVVAWIFSSVLLEFIKIDFIADSISAALVLTLHGLGMLLFINSSPQIEFS